MRKSHAVPLLFLSGLCWLAGCGGSGGAGLTLTGGSVPIGGRAVTGTVLLPNATPAANATVKLLALPAGNVVVTATTDGSGRFTAQGVPTNNDIEVVATQMPSNMLEAIIPQSSLASNPGQSLDIGEVTALSTVVTEAIKLEQNSAPEDTDSIVASQQGHLNMQVHDAGYSVQTQQQLISDPNSLSAQALTLMVPAANTELAAYYANPSVTTATTALNGLLGFMRGAHECQIHLDGSLRTALINAQLAGKQYAPDAIATALQVSGVQNATATQVSAASQRERTALTALGGQGSGISAFEALVIAADIQTGGGFHLDENALSRFLTTLLNSH